MIGKNWRFYLALTVVAAAIVVLIVSAVKSSAKAVVTVDELLKDAKARENIRVGARVSEGKIENTGGERPVVRFFVGDIKKGEDALPGAPAAQAAVPPPPRLLVVYEGLMPDTLKSGRDVILEGRFDGTQFAAKNLLTQCPSKYKPPTVGEEHTY